MRAFVDSAHRGAFCWSRCQANVIGMNPVENAFKGIGCCHRLSAKRAAPSKGSFCYTVCMLGTTADMWAQGSRHQAGMFSAFFVEAGQARDVGVGCWACCLLTKGITGRCCADHKLPQLELEIYKHVAQLVRGGL